MQYKKVNLMLLQAIGNYLAKKPFEEVAGFIQALGKLPLDGKVGPEKEEENGKKKEKSQEINNK